MQTKRPANIDEYISAFPDDVQEILEGLRKMIKEIVPEAQEKISYNIPAFNLNDRYLIYFAAFKKHIGVYPIPANNEEFMKDFIGYKTGKGSVQFPYDKPIPATLIAKIIKFRINEYSKNDDRFKFSSTLP